MLPIVLASSSPFRRAILAKIIKDFDTCSPDIDESVKPNESPEDLVLRLAQQKAEAVAKKYPNHLIIGSDQVAVFEHQIIGKPHNKANAVKQLSAFSGNRVRFLTSLCLLNSESAQAESTVVPFDVQFRHLSTEEISNYLDRETPYQCAGSFKSEGLGIALFERLIGDDPNTLIGLPLIQLCKFLRHQGVKLL